MRRERFEVILVAASALLCCFAVARTVYSRLGPPSWGAAIVCRQPVLNLGRRAAGEFVHCEFAIENVGRKQLRIEDVVADCHCVKPKLKGAVIPPQHILSFTVRLLVPTKAGALDRRLLIVSNDPQTPKLPLRIIGIVTTEDGSKSNGGVARRRNLRGARVLASFLSCLTAGI